MILYCNYEEMQALKAGAHTLLSEGERGDCAVAAPPMARSGVEALMPRLVGDLTISTLSEQRTVQSAVEAIVSCLRVEMETTITATHAADEMAVAAYFDFAHALTVLDRLREMRHEMEAMIEVVTGGAADDRAAGDFVFPD